MVGMVTSAIGAGKIIMGWEWENRDEGAKAGSNYELRGQPLCSLVVISFWGSLNCTIFF